MRPRLSESELLFLLDLLKETEANRKRQLLSFQEEQKHLESSVYALKHRMLYETPYPTYQKLKEEKQKLATVQLEWLPILNRQTVILKGLIIRLEKILNRKPGRTPYIHFFYSKYLQELEPKNI